ncbi:MAG: class I SAM-dependent methyltransferase [Actinomycetota bacterium]|nr:class I SAM-dependent methyltransferase [Actinomycetota bacterium]
MTTASGDRLHPRVTEHSFIQLRSLAAAVREEARQAPAGIVLDLGCGGRPYAELFSGRYVGLDVAVFHGEPDLLGVAERVPIRDGSIDIVLSTQHLEHADDPGTVLDEARRVLAPGGLLLLSTHGVWVHHPDPHDYWRWTEEGLRRLMEAHGFAVERVHRQGELFTASLLLASYPFAGIQRSKRPMARRAAGTMIAAFNGLALALDAMAGRVLPRHYASAGYLVAAKRRVD